MKDQEITKVLQIIKDAEEERKRKEARTLHGYICHSVCKNTFMSATPEELRSRCSVCQLPAEIKALEEKAKSVNTNCFFFVRDKTNGTIHQVGTDRHDSVWVDNEGQLHYANLQNGDGCWNDSHNDNRMGYEFMPSQYGVMEGCQDCSMACDLAGELRQPCEKYRGRFY